MRNLSVICILSAIVYSVICQPGPKRGRPRSRPYNEVPSFPSSSLPRLPHWRETIVHEWGHSEVAFFRGHEVFFIDTYKQNLCSFHIPDRSIYCAIIGRGLLSFAVPCAGELDRFVLGCGKDIVMVKWNSSTNVEITPHFFMNSPHQPPNDPLPLDSRASYGSIDHGGRLWFATTSDDPDHHAMNLGRVYSLDKDALLHKRIPELNSVTGGFAWDRFRPQQGTTERTRPYKFFYADTPNREIIEYDFMLQTGIVEKVGVALNFTEHNVPGKPGRFAVDAGGLLWVPLIGGHRVIQYDPFQNKVVQTIRMPAAKVGACAFGGPNWDILYVSTIGYAENENRPGGDEGGHIYAIHNLELAGVQTREYVLSKNIMRRASTALKTPRFRINSGGGMPSSGGRRGPI